MKGARPTAQASIPVTARSPRWPTHLAATGKNSCRRPARIVDVVHAADLRNERHVASSGKVDCEDTLGQLGDEWVKTRSDHETDESRWNKHLKPFFGHLKPQEVDEDLVRDFIKDRLALKGNDKLEPATVGRLVHLLSALYRRLIKNRKRTGITVNPVALLDKDYRNEFRSDHDPKQTPFVKNWADVYKIIDAFEKGPAKVMYAVGVYTGMRPAEIRGLHWENVHLDLERPFVYVCQQVYRSRLKNRTKGRRTREYPSRRSSSRSSARGWRKRAARGLSSVLPRSAADGPGPRLSTSRSTRCGGTSRAHLPLAGFLGSHGMKRPSTPSRATTS